MRMRKGEVWGAEYGFRGELYIVNTANKKMAVVYPQGDSDEEKAIARLIAAAPEMRDLLLQIHAELSHTASADADPENWEGYTLHRIEQLLWPENTGGNHETG